MTNFQIYQKTLPFSLLRLLYAFLGLVAAIALPVVGFLASQSNENACLIVTGVCAVVGLVLFVLLARYLGYMLTAGQVAMMTEGITQNEVPQPVLDEGRKAVKAKFLTANVYFALYGTIKAITQQITRGITGAATALGSLGGEEGAGVGGAIGGTVSSFVAVMLEYVNYCCLAWVFRHPEQNAFKSTCDGAVIYFQTWKTLLKNALKVCLITLVSLVVIAGVLTVVFNAIFASSPTMVSVAALLGEAFELDAAASVLLLALIVGVIGWSILHAAFIKPYILVSVLRKYMEAAETTTPGVDVTAKLCALSKRFQKAMEKGQAPAAEA